MDIVTREEWGAAPPKGTSTGVARLTIPTKDLVLHHAGSSGGGAARVRAIQRFHMESRGWGDIAYHYLIDSDGTVYEGVGGGIRGAATFGHNLTSHALCLLGNFNTEHPDSRATGSLVEVIRWGHGKGWWPNKLTGGHRDFRSTSCPGDNLYRLIPAINQKVLEPQEEDVTPEQMEALAQRSSDLSVSKLMAHRLWATSYQGQRVPFEQAVSRDHRNITELVNAYRADQFTDMTDEQLSELAAAVNDELARRVTQR